MVIKPHFPAFPYFHGFTFAYHLFALTAAVASTLSFPAADSPVRLRHGVAMGRNMGSSAAACIRCNPHSTVFGNLQRIRSATAYMVSLRINPASVVSAIARCRQHTFPTRKELQERSNTGLLCSYPVWLYCTSLMAFTVRPHLGGRALRTVPVSSNSSCRHPQACPHARKVRGPCGSRLPAAFCSTRKTVKARLSALQVVSGNVRTL